MTPFGIAAVLVAGLAGASVLVLLPAPACARAGVDLPPRPRRPRLPRGAAGWSVLGALLVAAGAAAGLPPALALLAVGVAGFLTNRAARARRRRLLEATREQLAQAIVALCGEITAGLSPEQALAATATEWRTRGGGASRTTGLARERAAALLSMVDSRSRLGERAVTALVEAAEFPGAEALRRLAGAWQVAESTGSPLAVTAGAAVAEIRREQAHRSQRALSAAEAQASARLIALLPLAGLALGAGLGAAPVEVLLHTAVGAGCLVVGVLLELVGLWWSDRLVEGQ